jgi:hypothetical protein
MGTLQMVPRELVNVLFDSHKYGLAASLSELQIRLHYRARS